MNIQVRFISIISLIVFLMGCSNNKLQNDENLQVITLLGPSKYKIENNNNANIQVITLAEIQKISCTNRISDGVYPIDKIVFLTGGKTDSIYLKIKGDLINLAVGQMIRLEYNNADSLIKVNSEPAVTYKLKNEEWDPILPPHLLDSTKIN